VTLTDERLQIRLADERDAGAVGLVLSAAFGAHRSSYTAAAFAATVPTEEAIRQRLATGTKIWIASRAGEPVGTVAATDEGTYAHAQSVAVAPGHQSRGTGNALLAAVVE
jgi:ribosomal protein S18 acetylase RimI-like enzyme